MTLYNFFNTVKCNERNREFDDQYLSVFFGYHQPRDVDGDGFHKEHNAGLLVAAALLVISSSRSIHATGSRSSIEEPSTDHAIYTPNTCTALRIHLQIYPGKFCGSWF